jgi:hypothetical protein
MSQPAKSKKTRPTPPRQRPAKSAGGAKGLPADDFCATECMFEATWALGGDASAANSHSYHAIGAVAHGSGLVYDGA